MKIISRFLGVLLLLFVVYGTIGAAEPANPHHIIAYYSVEVKGSSDPKMLKAMISPPGGDPPFPTKEAMEKALNGKRSKLYNMRLFEEVSYTYEVVHSDEKTISYRVKFFVDDAFTFLAIPYPKYDSNYGFRMGIKGYDKNLLGKFADLYFFVNATQIENNWDDWIWNAEIAVKKIPVGRSTINLGGAFSVTQHGSSLEDLAGNAEIAVVDIPVGKSTIDVKGTFKTTQHGTSLEESIYTGSIDWRKIPLAQTTLDLNVNLKQNVEPEKLERFLITSVQWAGLPWFNSTLLVKPTFQFKQTTIDTPFDIDYASFYSSVNPIMINGEAYVWAHNLTLKFPHEYVRSTASLTSKNVKVFNKPVSFWISADNYFNLNKQEFYNNTYTVGSSIGLSLPLTIKYQGTYKGTFRTDTTTDLNLVPVLSTTQAISFGRVNWKRNLRQGLLGKLSATVDYALFTIDFKRLDYINYTAQAELEGYLKLGQRIGLSGRAKGFYSHVPSFTWYSNQHFPSFMPNSKVHAPELLRGILNATYDEALGENAYQKLGMVANLDATLMFIKFNGFAEGFASVFMDIGMFTSTYATRSGNNDVSWDDITMFKTIGFEGYGILDKFPSYPIRASLGFNLDDFMQHLAGEIGFNDIEMELTIGMGLHY
ncbi:MAG: hypothetical protein WDA21_04440 [Bacilli bacterium]